MSVYVERRWECQNCKNKAMRKRYRCMNCNSLGEKRFAPKFVIRPGHEAPKIGEF